MKTLLRIYLLLCVIIATNTNSYGQCVALPVLSVQNPSFEGTPQPHVTPSPWTNCQPSQTPDTQPGSWGVTLPATNGSTYLGLVHDPASGWQEGASQLLSSPMSAGIQYTFTIDLANSSSTSGGIDPGCAELRIYGGNSTCAYSELLWASGNITPFDVWQTYTVTFTPTQNWPYITLYINSLGCSLQPYILVDNMSPILPENVSILSTLVDNNVACPGQSNGTATVHASGANTPFLYSWNTVPPQTDSVLHNVQAGIYSVTVTDANTCTATASVTISEPQPITFTPLVNNVTCNGFNTGSAYMSYAGGTRPFTFLWSNNVNTQNNSGLFAGTYGFTATDANGCTANSNINITEPTALSITGNAISPTCQTSGSITTTTTGGRLPYTYSWNTTPVQTTANISGLPGGSYTITVTDSSGCTASAFFTLSSPPNAPSIILTPINTTCYNSNNGAVNSSVTGGTSPYTYIWNTCPAQNGANATNLTAGNYTVTVSDANSCSITATATVTAPTQLTISTSVNDILCFGASTGTASASPTGGTGTYSYLWNSSPPQNTATAVSLPSGTYNLTVTDANNCTATSSVVVSQPASAVQGSVSPLPVSCFGGNDGSATATPTGGTSGYTFSWSTTPTQTSATALNLSAGNYTLTITDANNCTISVSTTINQPATAVAVSIQSFEPACFGQGSSYAIATGNGGSPGYNFAWSNNTYSDTAYNLSPGNYTVTISDANSCSSTASTTIGPSPTPLLIAIVHTNVLCYGDSTGTVTLTASGSHGGYSYVWSTTPQQTTASLFSLPAGTYNVTVTDQQGCSATNSEIVTQPASAVSITTSSSDVLCRGFSTGSATANVSGGMGGYTYHWNSIPSQTTVTATGLTAGVYQITANDSNGCSVTDSATISEPTSSVTVAIQISEPLCYGQATASAFATGTGGTPGYSFTWSTTETTDTIRNLSGGVYVVTITDANNCSATSSITVSPAPTPLLVSTSHTDVLCYGGATGSASVTASGSYGNYSYTWNTLPLQNSSTATALIAGTYQVTVTDVQGCSATGSETISQPASAVTSSVSSTNILCYGDATGTASVVSSGGTLNHSYQWSTTPAQSTSSISNLSAGLYYLTITDANNCSTIDSTIISQPSSPLSFTSNSNDLSCFNSNDGSASVVTAGGTNPYTYLWSTVPPATTTSISNLLAGNYSVTITDLNNCSISTGFTLSEPNQLSAISAVTPVSCPGFSDGGISVTISGGTPNYSYQWSNNLSSSANQTNLDGGSYSVTITDANSCTISLTNLLVTELLGVQLSSTVNNVLCFPLTNGSINITASSSFLPITFLWSNGSTGNAISNLDTGSYYVTVTDAHNCSATDSYYVSHDNAFQIDVTPDNSTIDLGESVNLSTSSTLPIDIVTWQTDHGLSCNDCSDPVASPVQSITYKITATDLNGCVATDTAHITVIPDYNVFIPNAFTPNGDGNNDYFEVFGNKNAWKNFDIKLFNRWGEKVYESTDMNFKWDGTYKGLLLNPTVLVYEMHLTYLDNYTDKLFKGSLTLIR